MALCKVIKTLKIYEYQPIKSGFISYMAHWVTKIINFLENAIMLLKKN